MLDRRTIHVPDLQAEVDEYPESSSFARSYGFRTVLNVPLLRGAEAIGAISIRRTEVRPFTDRQIELLKTFADQAMIAIENVRLFTELQEKEPSAYESTCAGQRDAGAADGDQRDPAGHQPARLMSSQSSTPSSRSAVRLCGAVYGNLFRSTVSSFTSWPLTTYRLERSKMYVRGSERR